MKNIRIGTMVHAAHIFENIENIGDLGFESFEINFGTNAAEFNMQDLSKRVMERLGEKNIEVSCLGGYDNTLENEDSLKTFEILIDNAHLFNTNVVAGFSGCITGRPFEEAIPKFTRVFTELCKRAADKNVKIALENCSMGGTPSSASYNMAINPKAWELLFNAVPYDNLGLEWEPCHQVVQFIDPIAQLRKWTKKIYHLHGKDATIAHDVIREHGINSGERYVWDRTPGFGDTNWTDVISILRMNGYSGNIDIEGWHDPVYRGDLEMTGQVHGLHYLKTCRGGDYVDARI
ncbi:sugar phosphate isomerase [Spirochaetia bacterium]|nr:sugar phosphate isomerase [Spirochaetia bacterium]